MRKADKHRKSERKKLEKHRQKFIRREKKLAKKQQKQLKREMSGWKIAKRAQKLNIFRRFKLPEFSFKIRRKSRLKSPFIVFWENISRVFTSRRNRKEQHKIYPEKVSIHRKSGFVRFFDGAGKFFSKRFGYSKRKKEERFLKIQSRQHIGKREPNWIQGIPGKMLIGPVRLFTPKKKRDKLKPFSAVSWDSRYLIGLLFKIREIRNEFAKSVINSTTLFILAFLAVYYINNYVTIYTAQFFDIPTVLFSYRIFWPLYTYSSLYTRQALVATFGMGPFVCLLLAILFIQVLRWLKKYNLNLKLFALWMSFHALNIIFGGYISGIITRTGFMYAVEWLFLTGMFDKTEIFLLISAVIMMFGLGFFSTSYFLMAVNAKTLREPKYRKYFLLGNVAIPWILGNLSLFLINVPNNPAELLFLYASSILFIIPVFSNYNSPRIQLMKFERISGDLNFGWIYILVSIAAITFIRMFIYDGISYG